MKVFTVGLDQKPPLKDASDPATEKAAGGSPPPGYVASTKVAHVPLPMGPEMPQPPLPIVVRKSRGYKGILMVMLTVFLMALFALTLSEIAYNRQRDENFFRLRWAELKHRLGYGDNAFDYYHRAHAGLNNDRFFSLGRNKELSEALIQQSETSSTTTPVSTTAEPVVIADSFPPKPSSFEQQPNDGPAGMIRDARLQFLKTILQKIKQHAEDMGFDGTMQVSVIEVEPQNGDSFSPFGSQHQQPHQLGAQNKGQSFHPLLPNFFPHLPIEEQSPKSDSFLDGFGEYHQPSFMQNNQVVEQNRARNGPFGGSPWPHDDDSQQQPQQQQPDFGDAGSIHWPRANSNPFRPDGFFHPSNNWQPQQQGQQQQQGFPQPPHILPRPPSFDRWSGGSPNNMLEGDESARNQHQPHQPMIQIFPQQPPMNGNGQQQPEQAEQSQKSNENGDSSANSGSPSQEVVGEIYGRKFGRMLQDIIANRIQGFQNLQQMNPLMVPPSVMGQPEQRSRLPFGGEGMNPGNMNMGGPQMPPPMPPMGGSPFFPPQQQMGQQQQQMPMPQQWWQPAQQQQIPPSQISEEGKGGDKMLPPPPPVIFFPMGQAQGQQGQQPPFPSFQAPKELMGPRKDFGQQPPQLQFPVFKNFIPPEDRIQVEPPQTFPNQPQQQQPLDTPIGQQNRPSGSNSDEPLMKGVVDNNMAGPRGWTHQFPKSSQQDQDEGQQKADNSDDAGPNFNSAPAEEPKPVDASTGGNGKSSSGSASREQPQQDSENADVWLVAPPHRTQPPREQRPPMFSSSEASTAAPSVDFPAVKFPMMTPNNNNEAPDTKPAAKPIEALSTPQNDNHPAQPLLSNPVFFQVDDPSSIEQQQPPRTVA